MLRFTLPFDFTRKPSAKPFALFVLVAAIASLGAAGATAAEAKAVAKVDYDRDVRPILAENCYKCHGPDAKEAKAGLRLDIRESALKAAESGEKAIVPGKPDDSELVRRIFATDPDELMPPPESHKQLTDAQRETLKRWIADGAAYEAHWAYRPIVRPAVPRASAYFAICQEVKSNPIDAFILAKLAKEKVTPSPEADRATLLRRLSLDLIGLPPTPDEVRAFVADTSPQAYDKAVDRLLASPHYGERMAVPWLDVVRFADTVGYHGDQNVNVFPYRDYVINAFNSNKPFDKFTIEQLAGDLLPDATTEQKVATGFNRLNMVTREGGAQPGEYLARYAADRVRTVAATWLGSSMGCCECHNHKFDPFTARDFYSMEAFFADVKQWGVYADYGYTPNPDLKGWSNDHPFPPEIVVESPYLKERQKELAVKMDQTAKAALDRKFTGNDAAEKRAAWRAGLGDSDYCSLMVGWKVIRPKPATKDWMFTVSGDGSILFGGTAPTETISFPLDLVALGMIRVELLPLGGDGGTIIRGEGGTLTIKLSGALKSLNGKRTPLKFYYADANLRSPQYANGAEVLGILDGWTIPGADKNEPHTGIWMLEKSVNVERGSTLEVTLPTKSLNCVRVSAMESIDPTAFEAEGILAHVPVDSRRDAELNLRRIPDVHDDEVRSSHLDAVYLWSTAFDLAALQECRRLFHEYLECRDGKSPTVVTEAREPRETRILPRGNWQDKSGDVVLPNTPMFLPQLANRTGRRFTRRDLAEWIVSPENPLTARVVVNRMWKQFFGEGLSKYVDDLGAQGEPPSHPELLDWLAAEFRDSGWDVKHLVRLIVTSDTYRQSANLRPELRDRDPGNRWLASQSPRRLEAEFIRDQALAVAGLLNLDIGGPSVHPYQPAGYYANLQFPDRDYVAERDDRQYRRGLYMHWQRTFLHPMLANFDAPSREECTASRVISNTPQQALTLLNDPTFVEAARVLAETRLPDSSLLPDSYLSDPWRIDDAMMRTAAHTASKEQRESLLKMLADEQAYYGTHRDEATALVKTGIAPFAAGEDMAQFAAWTNVCRVILNLHESITRY